MLTVKTRMYIGTRKTEFRQHDDTYPFDALVLIDMGKIDGGGLLDLTNGRGPNLVRLHERNATEFQTDMYGRPLSAFDAGTVLSAIRADLFEHEERAVSHHYQVALAALEVLAASLPSVEVVFEAYTTGHI